MNSTSLQNIITTNTNTLQDRQIRTLFQPRVYPSFQLQNLKKKDQMASKDQVIFFIRILERWNADVAKGKKLTDCEYVKNQFIYSWLKSIAVQNDKFMDNSITQLYTWYCSNNQKEPVCKVKKENVGKSRLQEWEIRNSYKSNLPLEIGNYRRRYIFESKHENQPKLEPNKTYSKTCLQSPKLSVQKQNSPFALKKQNNYLRGVREQSEIDQFLKGYKRNKIYFYKNNAKNYYKNQFSRDKLLNTTLTADKTDKLYATDQIKNYRIKTTMGFRPFATTFAKNQTAYSTFYNSTCNDDMSMTDSTDYPRLAPSNVDGLGLMANPFQLKLRKKKKK